MTTAFFSAIKKAELKLNHILYYSDHGLLYSNFTLFLLFYFIALYFFHVFKTYVWHHNNIF
jgi:hypothetical protein